MPNGLKKGWNKPTKGQRQAQTEGNLKKIEMQMQLMQMLQKNIADSISSIQGQLNEVIRNQKELQYRVLAIQELQSLDKDQIQTKSLELQITDFNETSDKEDKEEGYLLVDKVDEDSIVIITSTTPEEEEDKGVLRSKIALSEMQVPEMRESLLGKGIDDVVDVDVRGVKHNIRVLGIRKPDPDKKPEIEDKELNVEVNTTNGGEAEATVQA